MSLKPLNNREHILRRMFCGDKYYVLLDDSINIAQLNLDTGEICILDEQCQDMITHNGDKLFDCSIEVENKIFFPLNWTNKLVEFNTEHISYKSIELPILPAKVTIHRGIGRWGDCLYFSTGKETVLLRYDLKKKEAECLQVELSNMEHMRLVISQNLAYFLPKDSNLIEVVDLDDLSVKQYDSGLDIKGGGRARIAYESNLILVDDRESVIYFWSIEGGLRKIADIGREIKEDVVFHKGKLLQPWFKEGVLQQVDIATGQISNLYPAPEDYCIDEKDLHYDRAISCQENDRFFIWIAASGSHFLIYDKLTETAEWKNLMISDEALKKCTIKYFESKTRVNTPVSGIMGSDIEKLLIYLSEK